MISSCSRDIIVTISDEKMKTQRSYMSWPKVHNRAEILAARAPCGIGQLSSGAQQTGQPGSDPGSTTVQPG